MTLAERLLGTSLPSSLLPETRLDLEAWGQQQLERLAALGKPPEALPPSFPFQDLPASARLSYELVNWQNIGTYLTLFAADPSPFVDARFRDQALLEQYAVDLLTYMRYSWKRGGCDWLLRRRSDGQAVGVLHLYDLSHEVIGPRVPHCTVGFAMAAPFRRLGLGQEGLEHLLVQAASVFGRTEARAITEASNAASERLLQSSGFTVLEQRPAGQDRNAKQLWQRLLR